MAHSSPYQWERESPQPPSGHRGQAPLVGTGAGQTTPQKGGRMANPIVRRVMHRRCPRGLLSGKCSLTSRDVARSSHHHSRI
ncbi:hypothetical protein SCLCIDRAFT_1218293 [Scleroderma citrinum Foug A]|uniref:Uncharacterized protein n=1 Tax=Scleroderma citrinum Foug A TaxID=1036808 RepID=A0A0C3DRB0_9AGAM|nr:hypothetical protein SCLCIDRAFT_1218293 [Scleroderma citrinum Foug A]